MVFHDRAHAGRLLAERLVAYRDERPIVFGLTRGGVPVAFEVARRLGAPLEPMVVRKIGAPGWPELAIGALAERGGVYVSAEALRALGVSEERVAALAEREAVEVARRVAAFRGDRAFPDVGGRTVILVDDGVATGATARAAGRAVRGAGARRVILAAPVVAALSEPALRSEFDELVALEVPEPFVAVGMWYARFDQLTDEQVLEYLRRARAAAPATPPPAEGGELWNGEWTGPELDREPRRDPEERPVEIAVETSSGPGQLEATLGVPERPRGLVVLVHGGGSTRRSPPNRFVARRLQHVGFATLLLDLLTPEEALEDGATGRLRFDVDLLAGRIAAATAWIAAQPDTSGLPLACFGASTGAAAALVAAAAAPGRVAAIISRGGRPDLVDPATLRRVRAPVLLIVGGRDAPVLELNRAALALLPAARLEVVRGATHLFEEPGALEAVVRLSAEWLELHLGETARGRQPAAG